jgi:hypothetical protein
VLVCVLHGGGNWQGEGCACARRGRRIYHRNNLVNPQPQLAPLPQAPTHWNLTTRIAFRFCFVYFGLFSLTGQIFSTLIPGFGFVSLWLIRQPVLWTAAHIFHVKQSLIYTGSGSGDKTFDWVLTFCVLAIAALAAILWSIIDRRRENYTALHKWFRV